MVRTKQYGSSQGHRDKFEYTCHQFNKRNVLSELPFVSECYQYHVSKDITLQPVHQFRDFDVLSVFHTRSTTLINAHSLQVNGSKSP